MKTNHRNFILELNRIKSELILDHERMFRSLGKLKSNLELSKANHIISESNRAFKEMKLLKNEHLNLNVLNAVDFNIFEVLKFNREEEQLHNKFLAFLLNPNSDHGQSDAFYKLFIKRILPKKSSSRFILEDYSDYYVSSEEFIRTIRKRKGRIDIVIESLNPKRKFAVIIEIKWDSDLSSFDQLRKYYNGMKEYGIDSQNILLLYITKKGDPPSKKNISPKFRKYLKMNENSLYFNLSFDKDISEWLKQCISICKAEKINQIIKNYIDYIKKSI